MLRFAVALVLASVSSCVGVAGLAGLSLSQVHQDNIVYQHALVLKPGATVFESVPIGLDPHESPIPFVDDLGFGLVARGHEADPTARWDGAAFRPGRRMGRDPRLIMMEMDAVAELGDGDSIRWEYLKLTLERSDHDPEPLALPDHYQLRTVLAAGPGRAFLVPNQDETRTFFVTDDGEFVPGPSTPPWMSTISGSDAAGTVVLVPGERIQETHLRGVALGGGAVAVGGGGLLALAVAGLRGRIPIAAVVLGVVLTAALVAGAFAALASVLRHGLVW